MYVIALIKKISSFAALFQSTSYICEVYYLILLVLLVKLITITHVIDIARVNVP